MAGRQFMFAAPLAICGLLVQSIIAQGASNVNNKRNFIFVVRITS